MNAEQGVSDLAVKVPGLHALFQAKVLFAHFEKDLHVLALAVDTHDFIVRKSGVRG